MSLQGEFAKYVADGLKAREASPAVLAARADPNDFCEHTFQDKNGQPIVQAPHHRLWQDTVANHQRVIFWMPIEHGKTTQVKMTLCRLLGMHGDRQYGVIGANADKAKSLVRSVKQEIESNRRLHEVYPKLKPQTAAVHSGLEQWGVEAIRVQECPRGIPDPSLAAYGMEGKILGARLHGAIIDNGLDSTNTYTTEQREKTFNRLKDEIFGRVIAGGFIWILDTAWFEDDFMHQLAKMPGWKVVKLDAETALREGDATLWPAQWPLERLHRKRDEELGPTAYDRQFRNKPLSETQNYFRREYWDQAYGRVPWLESLLDEVAGINPECSLRTGVDLASRKGKANDSTAFVTVISSGHRRRVIHIRTGKMDGTDILRAMLPIYRLLHAPVNAAGGDAQFVVEDNAAQKYIVDMARDAAILRALGLTEDEIGGIRVKGRTTTGDKRSEEFGIPMVAAGLEMGRMDLAPGTEALSLREEMRVWHPGLGHHTGDRLMALWHALADMAATGTEFRVDFI